MSAEVPPAVLPSLSLDVGFGGPAQLSPLPSRSTRPAIPNLPLSKSLPTPRRALFDLAIAAASFRFQELGSRYRDRCSRDLRKVEFDELGNSWCQRVPGHARAWKQSRSTRWCAWFRSGLR